jgi:parallel beta-helix repeat protein
MKTSFRLFAIGLVSIFLLAACGGGGGGKGPTTDSYTIGGSISGLDGSGLVLQCNAGDDLAISADGAFTFSTSVTDGADYSVTVLTQPTGPSQTCTVNNGAGTVSGADVTGVTVTCSTNSYTVGGTVSGLLGAGLVLQNNGGDDLTLNSGATSFTFLTSVADGAGYNVTVLNQPSGPSQTCTVNNGTGTVSGADVTGVTVTCSTNSYTVGGTVSGIAGSVVLQCNGGDDLEITSGATSFTFATPVADTADYAVTMLSSTGQVCTLSNSSGTVSGADVTGVALECTPVSVSALYNASGANWNDYVKNNGLDAFSADDTACDAAVDGPGYGTCLHGGEMRAVEAPGKSFCAGLTVSDALGAFDWVCDDSTGTARFVSTGLAEGKNLSDLIDFATPSWKQNSVTVLDGGVEHFTTAPAAWWSNPVVVDNDGGYLDGAGTIYVVTNDALTPATGGYIIKASSVGLVGRPGVIINGPGAGVGSYVVSADGTGGGANARDFLWVEGAVDAAGDDAGVYLRSVRFSALRNLKAENVNANPSTSRSGVHLWSSDNNTLTGVTATNNGTGASLTSSSNNTLTGVTASNNTVGVVLSSSSDNTLSGVTASNNDTGVYIKSSSNNTLSGVTASNNAYEGVHLDSSSNNNTLSGVTASNNYYGAYLSSSSDNTLSGVTASNNDTGVWLDTSSNNTLTGVTASNNNDTGVQLDNSSNNTLSGVTASNNSWEGVYLSSSSDNYFTEILKVGDNGASDCYVSGGTNSGLVSGTCTTDGTYGSGGPGGYGLGNISDAALYNGVTLADSFAGKVTTDDTANASDTDGWADYPADPDAFDWSSFENPFRGWGRDGIFGDTSSRGRWTTGTGRIWDWSLALYDTGDGGDPAIMNALSPPTGDDILVHTWFDTTTTTLLRNAVEVQGDGLGNENTLCETGETCLYMPNIGSYQGHGNLVGETFTPGALTGITLMKYETNGY